jgi:hypothetical protein
MKLNLFFLLVAFSLSLNAQTNRLTINPNIILPKDSIEKMRLITALNGFLTAAQQPNEQNTWVLPSEKIETYILLDEINGIEKSGKYKDSFFYKPYLTNLVLLKDKRYSVQVSYMGINEKTPMLRASFAFIAHKINDAYVFSSPLISNTKDWKLLKINNNIFHYKTSINTSKAKEYDKNAAAFDKKLSSFDKITEFYCCADFIELQKLIGVEYKSDYNSYAAENLNSGSGNRKVIVLGSDSEHFDDFDTHDLWHDRLSLVVPRKSVNKPIDEACAYLYGGSWGMTWKEIYNQFKTKIASNPNADWLNYKQNPFNFGESEEKHLMVDYVVDALIVQKLEKEKGFTAVWELLKCGKYEKSNENYFKTLEQLTGINKSNYNETVWELVNSRK